MCASEVLGNAVWTSNATVQLGDGDLSDACDQVNYFGGDVTINHNTGGVEVNGNIIRGNLTGTGNDPAPVGDHNRVRGSRGGQFANLAPAPQAARSQARSQMQARPQARSAAPDQVQATLTQAKQRKTAATAAAEQAGPAEL